MMASPTLTVLLDDGSGTFPFDISDKVLATESYDITRGRDDWQGAVTAGELSLTLNNSDGRFTPGSTILGTPSPIKVDQRIQLREGIGGGSGGWDVGGWDTGPWDTAGVTTFTRFTGYVKAWPVSWPATVGTFSTVRITATDAQARAERRPLRSVLEETVLSLGPTAYYTLTEAASATGAGDTSGNNRTSLTSAGSGTPFTFATGTGPDSLPAATFADGTYLYGNTPTTPWLGTGAWTVHADFSTTTGGNWMLVVLNSTNATLEIGLDTPGHVQVTGLSLGAPIVSPKTYKDGQTHDVTLTHNGVNNLLLYVDGSIVGSAFVVPSSSPGTRLFVGSDNVGNGYTGTLSQVALFDGVELSATQVAALSTAALSQFAGEAGDTRLTRLAGCAGVTVGTCDPSLTNVAAAKDWTGSFVGEQIQRTADAEFGLVYIDGTGALTFHNRNRVPAKTAPDLTLSSQYVTPDVQPVVDDQRLINYMEVSADGTGATNLVTSATSESSHGRYPGSQSYLVQTDAEALDRARWIVGTLAEPGAVPRYGTLTINLFGMSDSLASSVLQALDLDCWLRVISAPSQNPGGTTVDVIVQGWSASRTAGSWTITCNVVPRSLFAPAWVLETSQLDADTRLYV